MISEEKIKEVRRNLTRGEPDGEIREKLLSEGYSKEDIDKVFAPRPYDMRSWYLGFAFILLLVGMWNANLLALGFCALLLVQYYREAVRLKRERIKDEEKLF